MKYILENIRLRKVAEGKQNAGSLFVQADAVNPDDLFDEGGLVTIFNERLVNKYAEYLALAEAGGNDRFGRPTFKPSTLKDASKPLPESMTVMTHAKFEQYVFPGGPKQALDSDGKPMVNTNGDPVMRSAIYVFTKKIVDNETGELTYAPHWDPISVGQRIEAAMYRTLPLDTNPGGVVLPQGEDPLLTNSEIAPAAPAAPAA